MTRTSALAQALAAYVAARAEALTTARRALGLSDLEAQAVLHLADHPGLRAGDLGRALATSSAGATTLADRLVGRGLVRRAADSDDRRVVRLFLDIELTDDPWNQLTGFDDRCGAAIDGGHPAHNDAAAELLERLTAAARG